MMVSTDNGLQASPPAVSTDTALSDYRRTQARYNLLSNLKDRSIKGPVKWTRSLTEVNINNYKSECRQLGVPSLFQRHHQLPTALCRREEDMRQNLHSVMVTYSYHLQGDPDVKRMDDQLGRNKSPRLSRKSGLKREVTLTELYKAMSDKQKEQNSDDPGFRINIQNSRIDKNGIPNIKINMKPVDSHKDGEEFRLPSLDALDDLTRLRSTFSQKASSHDWNAHENLPHLSTSVTSFRGRVNDETQLSPRHLRELDRSQLSSAERTKRWLEDNSMAPVGKGKSEAIPPNSSQIDGRPQNNPGGRASKRVRFGLDSKG